MLRAIVLGAAAGGGFPQWNSNSEACRRVRLGDAFARPATQASIAVSADDRRWFVVNAAPDLREQINRERDLHPSESLRSSPIAGVVLTNGDVDAIAGLLHLRERTPFVIYAHPRILGILDENPIFRVLADGVVTKQAFPVNETLTLTDARGSDTGLRLSAFPVPGKVALFNEAEDPGANFGTQSGDTIGLEVTDAAGSARLMYIANCAAVTAQLRERCEGADVLMFDGTLWRDDEMVVRGEGTKTGARMGHMSMSGPNGSIAALTGLEIPRKIFIHINNTNPALLSDSEERRELESAGWQVAHDGMSLSLP